MPNRASKPAQRVERTPTAPIAPPRPESKPTEVSTALTVNDTTPIIIETSRADRQQEEQPILPDVHDPEMNLGGDAEGEPTEFLENYEYAKASYSWRLKGQHREPTPLEMETLYLWATKKIHLDIPPKYISETHYGPEQDALLQCHRTELGFRLYARLPPDFRVSDGSGKWHL